VIIFPAMDTFNLIEEVKKEIARLQKVVDYLEGSESRPGRKKKRTMSAAGRARISAAQKARWAKKKKAAA
jgi:hypothetical protein